MMVCVCMSASLFSSLFLSPRRENRFVKECTLLLRTGLAKNQTAPVPTLTPPRVPSITEQEQAVEMSLTADDNVSK